ncbi:glycerophosphodiester phosphodiesterase [Rhizobium sp. RU36D]|uniref:glycerophosphodiester phosphodiesterase n=1 Tax=Rhizobium sp. RU36D TaxID=1907415 RepID=UPI0009D899BF|nr:glycerophosphodiester phosphodiesterase [Rhizobium sp. RU36D]SMC70892.1 Glycerophosphoryl diester phosphodiesterase [Rhizobium sp. RU36D]
MTFTSIWTREHMTGAPVFVGGHRGASTEAGENSLAAFEQAVAAGADFIEFDWRLTADNIPVVFHDETLERLHGDAKAIGEISYAELHAMHPALLTVPQALTAVRGRICVLLDTKITEPEALGSALDLIAPHLGDDAAVAFGVRSLEASAVVRQRLPDSPMLGLFRDYGDYPALREMDGLWARLWEDDATEASIGTLQAMGLRVIIMAGQPTHEGVGVVTPERMHTILQRRPDAVMLNDVRLGLAARAADAPAKPNSPGG